MLKRTVITVLVLVVNILFRPAGNTGLESLVKEYKSQTKCGNVSVVVYDHGEISYYGDKEGLYQIGSMTKSFTGLAACSSKAH